jgi:hypothetical protein
MVLALQATLISFTLGILGAWDPSKFEVSVVVAVLIIGCLVTHTFLDIIPSVYLGAPEADTALSVLPGHRLMLAGRGYEAIKCSALGSFGSVLVALLALFPARLLMGSPVYAYEKLWPFIPFILIIIVTLLILNERGEKPDFAGKKPPKLVHLKISIEDSSKQYQENEEKSKLKQKLIPIKDVPNHAGESVWVRGVVTRIANPNHVFSLHVFFKKIQFRGIISRLLTYLESKTYLSAKSISQATCDAKWILIPQKNRK